MEPVEPKNNLATGQTQIRERIQAWGHTDFSSASLRRIAFMRAAAGKKK